MESVLVVEDDPEVAMLVERALAGLELRFAASLAEAREQLRTRSRPGLILLDLGLPDGDGFSLCSEIAAESGTRAPVIFLTSSDDARDVVTAFSLGAEDYVKKPFVALELRARVQGRLRDRSAERNVRSVGDLRIDLGCMRTYREHEGERRELQLTPTEQRLLQALVERPGRLLTRERLLESVWGDTIVGPRAIDAHLSNLRGKLGPGSIEIEAVRGLGYRISETR